MKSERSCCSIVIFSIFSCLTSIHSRRLPSGYRNDNYTVKRPVDNVLENERSKEPSDILLERMKLLLNLPKNGELFEGDMIMSDRLRDAVLDRADKRSTVAISPKWPYSNDVRGVKVPYMIHDDFLHHTLLEDAIRLFNSHTCIRLVKRSNEQDYLVFKSTEDTCSSNVGKVGGPQDVMIGLDCGIIGTLVHETMHNLGFIHEHSRPDRDQHVRVIWKNVKKDEMSNFYKYSMDEVRADKVPYNFNSVMQYRNDAFTKTIGQPTLKSRDDPDLKFGQRWKMSKGDVKSVNYAYCTGSEFTRDYINNANIYNSDDLLEDMTPSDVRKKRRDNFLKNLLG